MTLTFDAAGNPVARDLALHRETYFQDGALPAWASTEAAVVATATEGSTYAVQTTVDGGLLMSVAGVNGRRATVYGPDIDLSAYKVARIRARAYLDRDTASDFYGVYELGFRDDAGVRGAAIGGFNNGNAVDQAFQAISASSSRYLKNRLPELRRQRWLDLSMWVDCTTKTIYSGVGDTPSELWIAGSTLALGVIKPRVRIATHGPVKSALISRFSFTLWK